MLPRPSSNRIAASSVAGLRCIALSHAQLAVSGKLLNRPCRSSTHCQVRAERVQKDVDTLRDVRLFGGVLNPVLNLLSSKRSAIALTQHARATQVSMLAKRRCQFQGQRHMAQPPAFGEATSPFQSDRWTQSWRFDKSMSLTSTQA
jgi:hypothetical protein